MQDRKGGGGMCRGGAGGGGVRGHVTLGSSPLRATHAWQHRPSNGQQEEGRGGGLSSYWWRLCGWGWGGGWGSSSTVVTVMVLVAAVPGGTSPVLGEYWTVLVWYRVQYWGGSGAVLGGGPGGPDGRVSACESCQALVLLGWFYGFCPGVGGGGGSGERRGEGVLP